MSNKIDIEYCGSWGYGGPANRLKKSILENLPGVEVNCHSAMGKTGTIKVSWSKGGNLSTVWNKGRGETENGHAEIVALLKQNQWDCWKGA